jgi:hypothetical protein
LETIKPTWQPTDKSIKQKHNWFVSLLYRNGLCLWFVVNVLDYMFFHKNTFLFNDNFNLENYYLKSLKNIPTASMCIIISFSNFITCIFWLAVKDVYNPNLGSCTWFYFYFHVWINQTL